MTKYNYTFPEENPFRAMEATSPVFDIQENTELFKQLGIDFSGVRNNNFNIVKKYLGIINNKLENIPNQYHKIIYSGHRGSGKSTELKEFHREINNKDAYFSVFIDLEKYTNINKLATEDLYVVIISMLIKELNTRKIKFDKKYFEDISEGWVSEIEQKKETKNNTLLNAEAKASTSWGFWEFLNIEMNLKTSFSNENIKTKVVRRTIKNDPKALIEKMNIAFADVRNNIKDNGKDIVFIIDGLEKADAEVYKNLFISDPQTILLLSAHMVVTVPISAYYEIGDDASLFYKSYLPMIRINKKSKELFEELVYKRVDKKLIDDTAMGKLIHMSGGCPRILLKLVHDGFLEADKIITVEIADKVIKKAGNERIRTLTTEHVKILEEGSFGNADKANLELLQSLNVLEYNGDNIERKINPVLEFKYPQNREKQ